MNALRNTLAAVALVGSLALASLAQAGPPSGSIVHRDTVDAYTTDVYSEVFVANVPAFVKVEGDGDTDLDLAIYSDLGYLVVEDLDYTDDGYVTFTPSSTSRFTIKVRNLGSVYNNYTIFVW
jgi:hypothetical protein